MKGWIQRLLGRLVEWALASPRRVSYVADPSSRVPCRMHDGDAGYDLYASKTVHVSPGGVVDVPTSVCIEPHSRIWCEIRGRSSSIRKLGLQVQQGVIDRGYRGELFICVLNVSGQIRTIRTGDRVAQLIPHMQLPLMFVQEELGDSSRGTQGFGSTGI